MKDIFLWAALLYFIGFGLVCFKVREGNYPPPPVNTDGKIGFWAGVKTFTYESYGLAYYWYKYLGASFAFIAVASVGAFLVFFYKDIGLSLEQIGKIAGYVGVVGMILAIPAGILADRFNPARVFIITQVIGILICPAYLVFLFMDMSNQHVFYYHLAISILVAINGTFAAVSAGPFEMRSFPRERFGQFCSAQSIVRVLLSVIIGLGIGIIFDLLKDHYQSDFCYRYAYIGVIFFQILGFCCYYIFYRKWKKYGGETNYKPPIWTPVRD
jgi:MFS family permease